MPLLSSTPATNGPFFLVSSDIFLGRATQSQLIAMFLEQMCTTDFPLHLWINSNPSVKYWSLPKMVRNGAFTDGKVLAIMSNLLCSFFFGYHFAISHKCTFHSSNNVSNGAIWLAVANSANKMLVFHTSHKSIWYQ